MDPISSIFSFSTFLDISQSPSFQILPITIFLSLISGITVGFSLGLIGGGGSILAVPLSVYVIGIQPHVALGTSALTVAVNAITNLIHHRKAGHVRVRKGISFVLPGISGAIIGAQLGLLTPPNHILLLFGLFMIGIAIFMLRHGHPVRNIEDHTTIQKKRLIFSGLLVGIAAGYFGIGGGFLIAPTLIYAGGLNIIDAIGTSLLPVSAFGFTTAARYAIDNQINWTIAFLFVGGGIGGGMIGTRLSTKVPLRKLSKIFAVILILVAIYIIVKTTT